MICLHPHYISVLRWEFHLTNLSPFFIAAAYIFYHEKKFISVTIISLIAMTLKENAGVIAMGFGLLMITSKDSRSYGIILFSVSLLDKRKIIGFSLNPSNFRLIERNDCSELLKK